MNKKNFIFLITFFSYGYSSFGRIHSKLLKKSSNHQTNSNNNYSSPTYNPSNSYSSNDTRSSTMNYSNNETITNIDNNDDNTSIPTNYPSSISTSISSSTTTNSSQSTSMIKPITIIIATQTDSYSKGQSIPLVFSDVFSMNDLTNGLEICITIFPQSTASDSKQILYSQTPSYLIVTMLKTLNGKVLVKKSQHAQFIQIPTTIHVEYDNILLTSKTFFTKNTEITKEQNIQLFNIQSPITTTMSIKNFDGILVVS